VIKVIGVILIFITVKKLIICVKICVVNFFIN
jgi:hypothetical protein